MSNILSSESINHVFVNDLLKIILEESPSENYKWELDTPRSFNTIKGSYEPIDSSLLRTWLVSPTKSRQFTIYCLYRKMCCDHSISKTIAYKIIVH